MSLKRRGPDSLLEIPDLFHVMQPARRVSTYLPLIGLLIICPCVLSETFGQSKVVYEWTALELDWPSDADKAEALRNGTYVPERNLIAGIKIYKDDVYLTVPRWGWTSGVPITFAKVVTVQGQPKLQPFPDWAAQKQGDCRALQYVQSMEIDPNTGLLYVIDTGRVGIGFGLNPLNLCPPKLVTFDLNTRQEVDRYEFPETVVGKDTNFLNDIVLHYVNGRVRYAYISDVREGRLHVYDFETRSARNLEDPSMKPEDGNGSSIHIHGKDYTFKSAIDGVSFICRFSVSVLLSSWRLQSLPDSDLSADHWW